MALTGSKFTPSVSPAPRYTVLRSEHNHASPGPNRHVRRLGLKVTAMFENIIPTLNQNRNRNPWRIPRSGPFRKHEKIRGATHRGLNMDFKDNQEVLPLDVKMTFNTELSCSPSSFQVNLNVFGLKQSNRALLGLKRSLARELTPPHSAAYVERQA